MSKYFSEEDIRAINGLKDLLSHDSILLHAVDVMWDGEGGYLSRYAFDSETMKTALNHAVSFAAIELFDVVKTHGDIIFGEMVCTVADRYQAELERYIADNYTEIEVTTEE